ncbi:MAG TPA: hypothetical protein VGK67_15465 [Myxococcales bacterium]|jgi:hypothetical protein
MTGSAASCRERLSRLSRQQQVVAYLAFANEITVAARSDFLDGLEGFERAKQCNEALHRIVAHSVRLETGQADLGAVQSFAGIVCEAASNRGWIPLLSRGIALAESGGRLSRPSSPSSSWSAPRASS